MVDPAIDGLAFIDFVNLTDSEKHPPPERFPAVGSTFDAVVVDFLPCGELRLSARTSHGRQQKGVHPGQQAAVG